MKLRIIGLCFLCLGLIGCSLGDGPASATRTPLNVFGQNETVTPPAALAETATVSQTSETEVEQVPTSEPTPTDALAQETEEPQPVVAGAGLGVNGIEMHLIAASGGLDLVEQSGAAWVRRNALFWSLVETEPGERNWGKVASLEEELKNAASAGLETILIIRHTPLWAQKEKWNACGAVAPEAAAQFGQFVYDVVRRYSAEPFAVHYYEIGNEPDVDPADVDANEIYGCWGDKKEDFYGGEYYAEVLKAVYPRLKEANPEAQLLVGGLLMDCDPVNPPETSAGSGKIKDCTSSLFLEGVLKNGGGDYFDGVSFHGYDYYWGSAGAYKNPNWHSDSAVNGPVLVQKVNYLRGLLKAKGYPKKYLLNSEVGLLCGKSGTESACQTSDFKNTKAYYVAQSMAAAKALDLRANIWYSISGWRASGLIEAGLQPTLALKAFGVSAAQLDGVTPEGALDEIEGLLGYRFRKGEARLWVVWAVDGTEQPMQLAGRPEKVLDVVGNELASERTVVIGASPVYIWFSDAP